MSSVLLCGGVLSLSWISGLMLRDLVRFLSPVPSSVSVVSGIGCGVGSVGGSGPCRGGLLRIDCGRFCCGTCKGPGVRIVG